MSKRNEDGSYEPGYTDGSLDGATAMSSPGLLTIEEHAAALKVSAPILAAVKVTKGWNPGKKVTVGAFNEAVNAFLGSPIGGK